MIRSKSVAAIVGLILIATLGITACTKSKSTPPEQVAAQTFLDAFGRGDSQSAAAVTTDSAAAAATLKASLIGLSGGTATSGSPSSAAAPSAAPSSTASSPSASASSASALKGTFTVSGLADRTDSSATANYSASWTIPGVGTPWTYTGSLPMTKQGSNWLVSWSTSDVHPLLVTGSHLTLKRTQPARGAIEDSDGKSLFNPTPVVTVGIDPAQVTNLASVAATLGAVLSSYGITAADIVKSVQAVPPTQFVPIITLRRPAYEQVKPQIYNLPGVQFPTSTELLAPTSTFAQPLLGRVGTATKEIIDNSKGRIQAGDTTGLSGLQLSLDAQLAGTVGVEVYAATDSTGALGANLGSVVAAKAGTPVRLTLNSAAQLAADAALSAVPLPAALVAVQPSTGKILAVANSSAATDDIALNGEYPAGSTFKIATYTAEYTANPTLTAASPVDCPATTVVNGQTFENENKFSHGIIPMSAAFAYSCNTSAINLAMKMPTDAVSKAAAALGLGAKWALPVDAFSGSLPPPTTPNEQAAAAIGQGKVLVSPLLMASMAGASATGKPIEPSLLANKPGNPLAPLPAALTAQMNVLLRATVAQPGATANALGNLPGEVRGKTGTAEFGTDKPPKTHSWFAGSRGDLAFAVFVYGGDSGNVPALPIVNSFLTAYTG
ncbi:penicillin-binding transpeptidase domain-containing protein [Jatrophihabitans sp. DSM 45814]